MKTITALLFAIIISGTSIAQNINKPNTLSALTPNIMVMDVSGTIKFYTEILMFEVAGIYPEEGDPVWAHLKNGGAELMINDKNSMTENFPEMNDFDPGGTVTFYYVLPDAENLYQSVKDSVEVLFKPMKTFYGTTEFGIRDNNGYILIFASSPEEK